MNILITGGSSGIGLGIRTTFVGEGHDTTSWSRREGVDIRMAAAVRRACDKHKIPFDLVIHSAAFFSQDGDSSLAYSLRDHFETNCTGTMIAQQILHQEGLLADKALIVTISTSDLLRTPSVPGQVGYITSKAAQLAAMQTWAIAHPEFQFFFSYPRITSGTGMFDPKLGPAECTLRETVQFIKEGIDAVLSSH